VKAAKIVPTKIVPTPAAIGREALLVIGGAVLAALIIGQLPELRAWIRRQWGGEPPRAM
jgi:hypothetical protein